MPVCISLTSIKLNYLTYIADSLIIYPCDIVLSESFSSEIFKYFFAIGYFITKYSSIHNECSQWIICLLRQYEHDKNE